MGEGVLVPWGPWLGRGELWPGDRALGLEDTQEPEVRGEAGVLGGGRGHVSMLGWLLLGRVSPDPLWPPWPGFCPLSAASPPAVTTVPPAPRPAPAPSPRRPAPPPAGIQGTVTAVSEAPAPAAGETPRVASQSPLFCCRLRTFLWKDSNSPVPSEEQVTRAEAGGLY